MLLADPLSRRPDHEEGVSSDNAGQTLLKLEFFAIKAIQPGHASEVDDEQLLERIKKALEDDMITKDHRSLLNSGPREFGKALQE